MVKRMVALLEVGFVLGIVYALTFLIVMPLRESGPVILQQFFLGHVLQILVPIIWLFITRRQLAVFGITLRDFRAKLRDAMTAFLPLALGGASLGFVRYTEWHGSLIEVVVQLVVLFLVARSLSGKPNPRSGIVTVVLACAMFAGIAWWQGSYPGIGPGTASFVNYLFLVGLGEETLYRGFVQSRLNQVFDRRWEFYGVKWGWGVIIASALFGLSHLLNGLDLEAGTFDPEWWWALWTFFGGLVFAYVREKTGSIVASAILHGLPQALTYFFVRF